MIWRNQKFFGPQIAELYLSYEETQTNEDLKWIQIKCSRMEATQGFVIMTSPTKCWKIGLA